MKRPHFLAFGLSALTLSMAAQAAGRPRQTDACKTGSVVEGHLHKGLGHSETVNASLKDSVPFARKVISDHPITPLCSPSVQ